MKLLRSLPSLLLIGFFTTTICFAQTRRIDSLQTLMKSSSDTVRVNLMNKLGVNFRSIDKEKALEYFKNSIEESRKIDYIQGEIQALYSIGLTHGMTGDYAESLDYLNQCLALAKQHQDYE